MIQNGAKDTNNDLFSTVPLFLDRLEETFRMQIVSVDDRERQVRRTFLWNYGSLLNLHIRLNYKAICVPFSLISPRSSEAKFIPIIKGCLRFVVFWKVRFRNCLTHYSYSSIFLAFTQLGPSGQFMKTSLWHWVL